MTLRTRLTIAFLAVVLAPVLIGAIFVGSTVTTVGRDRAELRLELAAGAARQEFASLCGQLRTAAEAVALLPPGRRAEAADALVERGMARAVRVTAPGAMAAVTAGAPPRPWADCDAPAPDATGQEQRWVGYRAVAARVATGDGGQVWVGVPLDRTLAERLATASGAAVTLLGPGPDGAVHGIGDPQPESVAVALALAPDETGERGDHRLVRRLDPVPGQPLPLVLTTGRVAPTGVVPLFIAVVALAGLLAVGTAWQLARTTTRPLAALCRAAGRVASGDLTARVPVTGGETGHLAAAFNRMARRTQQYVHALTASRDQLRRHLAVLGDTLSSTHDLDRILAVTVRTAVAATGAASGAVLLLDHRNGILTGCTYERESLSVPVGSGVLGTVAATGTARRGRAGDGEAALGGPAPGTTYLVVPVNAPAPVAAARWPAPPTVRGVLAVYDRLGGEEFGDADQATLQTFAGQAGVAVDNVRIHEEAQRLSLTDPLTGLWNYRYLTESLRREVERASRFRHPLAVLALDLDRFKEINDEYGHPAGDAVLGEFADRLRHGIREVDLAFRPGGEEFVVLLPETGLPGATVLATRLGQAVREEPVVASPRGSGTRIAIPLTVSIGIAVYPDHALTPQALLDAADTALYAAKDGGRDTFRVAATRPPPVATALPVRSGGPVPDDDLPRAGRRGSATGHGDGVARGGGAQPPGQRRGG